jgi:predicted ATPase
VRVAFSGTHRAGKSTLVAAVAARLPRYATVDEPYVLLEDDGHEASDPPSIEDFEAQLARSIETLADAPADVLFDRCPADVLAYLLTHPDGDGDGGDAEAWRERVRDALPALDLIVFVPIEAPDRVAVAAHEDRAWRAAVDAALEALLIDDALGGEVEVLRVEGDVAARVRQVMARLAG